MKELLDNRLQYHGIQTLDLLNPTRAGNIAEFVLKTEQFTLYSFMHGGTTYNLIRQVVDIEVIRNNIAITGGAIAKALGTVTETSSKLEAKLSALKTVNCAH